MQWFFSFVRRVSGRYRNVLCFVSECEELKRSPKGKNDSNNLNLKVSANSLSMSSMIQCSLVLERIYFNCNITTCTHLQYELSRHTSARHVHSKRRKYHPRQVKVAIISRDKHAANLFSALNFHTCSFYFLFTQQ